MALDSTLHAFSLTFQVFLLDLILSGDNAVVIALACQALPPRRVKQVVIIGTSAAIGLRVLLTTLVGWLLQVPLLKLVGAALLIVIAIRLLAEETPDAQSMEANAPSSLWGAVLTVLAADLVMSLDNVVALAAVTQGSTLFLILGLLLSVPLLMFGSMLMKHLLQRYPILVPAGGALLGYIAGDIAVSDPAIVEAVRTQSPALTVVVPLLCAVFVVVESRIMARRRALLPRPATRNVRSKSRLSEPAIIGALTTPTPSIPSRPSPVALRIEANVATKAVLGLPTVSASAKSDFMGIPPFLAAIAGTVVLLASLYHFGRSMMLNPDKDTAYVCPGEIATVYYRHGGSSIRIASQHGEVAGHIDYNKISWDNAQASPSKLHLTPPDEIENSDNKTVTINGGSFLHIPCVRQK